MKVLVTAAATAIVLIGGAVTASAYSELDKAIGAGSFMHPTGPAGGVWGVSENGHQKGQQ
jgi:hypothetical protein